MSEQDLGSDGEEQLPGEQGPGDEEQLPPFPPDGATLPDGSPLPESGGEVQLAVTEAIQNVGPFWFCFLLNGRSWGQLALYAPGPGDADTTAAQTAGLLQRLLEQAGYRGLRVGYQPGQCP